MNRILVVVDMQNDFVNGVLGTKEAQAIVPNVIEKIKAARENGDQIIFTRDSHNMGYLETQEGRNLPVLHCVEQTHGWQIVTDVARLIDISDDLVLSKPTFGCVDLVDEVSFIEEAVGSIDEIELCGVCTGICVIANAVLAKTHFIETLVTVDALATACVTPISHKTAIDAMRLLQINIIGE